MEIEFLCLANSKKRGNRCIAGLRTDGGGWVRLVSCLLDGGLSDVECAYTDQSQPTVLDVVRAGVMEHRPQPHQPENWIVDGKPWSRLQTLRMADAREIVQPHISRASTLLGTYKSRLPYSDLFIKPQNESLTLISPTNVKWRCERGTSDWKLRVSFLCNGASYDLPVTDDRFAASLIEMCDPPELPELRLDPAMNPLFLISLSEPFDATGGDNPVCYTLVASVMSAPDNW